MENSIIIKVEKLLDKQTFTSKSNGNVYEKFGFVGKTQAQFPKTVAFTIMGADKFEKLGIVVGKSYNVSFDVESREWHGKYFTDITAWKAVCIDGETGAQANVPTPPPSTPAPQPQATPQAPTSTNGNDAIDNLPF